MSLQSHTHLNKNNIRIVFMGTPEFAVASLDALNRAGYHIAAVVTAPDKPSGRGMKLNESAVKKYALAHNMQLLQPEKLKAPQFVETLRAIQAHLQIVVAFRLLPDVVWNMPPMGTVNLHGSLLPQYRGAAPINWAVIHGESKTGVTTFKLQHQIDTGNILLQESFAIGEDETAGEVHDRMKDIGANLLVQTIDGLISGTIRETPQDQLSPGALVRAPKIFTETCRIDWNKPVLEVYNLIRGLSPYPGAFTMLDDKVLKIFHAKKIEHAPVLPPGKHETDGKHFLRYACADGSIEIQELQLEGKKRMKVEDFLRGYSRIVG
ncbi:MAG TPA: methionyl-tRNA formyltransferase [Agriterribacter sp.]|nr:methionyl-tRNA formyltransferase [Agriterribacter sp.]